MYVRSSTILTDFFFSFWIIDPVKVEEESFILGTKKRKLDKSVDKSVKQHLVSLCETYAEKLGSKISSLDVAASQALSVHLVQDLKSYQQLKQDEKKLQQDLEVVRSALALFEGSSSSQVTTEKQPWELELKAAKRELEKYPIWHCTSGEEIAVPLKDGRGIVLKRGNFTAPSKKILKNLLDPGTCQTIERYCSKSKVSDPRQFPRKVVFQGLDLIDDGEGK